MKETKDILTTEQKLEEIKYQAYRLGKVDEIAEELAFISQVQDLKSKEKYINELYDEFCD